MSSPSEPPSGDERRPGYYEDLFGERVRKIAQPANPSAARPDGRGVGVGIGAVVAVVLLALRILLGLSGSSRTPQPTMPELPRAPVLPPPVLRWEPEHPVPPDLAGRRLVFPEVEDVIDDDLFEERFFLPQPNPEDYFLRKEDVPVLSGLCFRLDRQAKQDRDSPGKRFWHFLDETGRKLVHEAAGRELSKGDEKRLLEALNQVLRVPLLYKPASFQPGHLPPRLRILAEESLQGKTPRTLGHIVPLNRWLLETTYRRQVLPQHFRKNPTQQILWRLRAQADLLEAQREARGINP